MKDKKNHLQERESKFKDGRRKWKLQPKSKEKYHKDWLRWIKEDHEDRLFDDQAFA